MAKKPTFPGTRKRALDKRAMEEEDPAWRAWYLEVAQRRADLERTKHPFVAATHEWDGETKTVARKKSEPVPLKKLVKTTAKPFTTKVADDLEAIRAAWQRVAGPEIAQETTVYSFRAGHLTISVASGILLQELRQFQTDALLKDLRDLWPAATPLVQLKFRPGKR